jgi:two-component system, OmpR family, response regulator
VESNRDRRGGYQHAVNPGQLAVTRRIHGLIGGAELILTPGDPRVLVGGRRAILRLKELEFLELLLREPERLVKTATLAKQLAHGRKPLSNTTVAVHAHRLRIRLKPVGLTVRSFRGAGYVLEPLEATPIEQS